ncbi:MAG: ATP synthase F1 subunit epsilon [Clostridia bacterium]|nr:ATP synthase F1 subunit epsilon [Clostridia bacterium]
MSGQRSFRLEVLTPERPFYRGDCVSLTVQLEDGMLGIMAGHSPLTAALPDGEISFIKPDGEKVICAVASGMIDVDRNDVRLLCGSALLPEEIDAEEERRAIAEAELKMKQKQSRREYMLTKIAIAKSLNKLRVKNHGNKFNNNI